MSTVSKTSNIPLPGLPVRGSKSGKPIMVLFDLLGRRWAMGIVWNLHERPCTFRELQDRCDSMSPTVLNTRLKELRASKLIRKSPDGYCLTEYGIELYSFLEPLGLWAKDWCAQLDVS